MNVLHHYKIALHCYNKECFSSIGVTPKDANTKAIAALLNLYAALCHIVVKYAREHLSILARKRFLCHDIDSLKSSSFAKNPMSQGCAMTQMYQQQKKEKIKEQDEKTKKRQDRLAQQLRENLKRRKEQSKKRAQQES